MTGGDGEEEEHEPQAPGGGLACSATGAGWASKDQAQGTLNCRA